MSTETKGPTILEKIYAQRAKDVGTAKSTPGTTPEDIASLLASNSAPPLISFLDRLKRNPATFEKALAPTPSLMAEIKRASPSKGPIALSTNPAQQALAYALAGASVISVLTEPTWFHGSLLDLRLARAAVDNLTDRPAILRKEFILDVYQIAEARLHGADTVLLIVAMLSLERLHSLYHYSVLMGMEPLVEVNNASEMKIALDLGARAIGVNNRNLHDFNVDMGTTSRLADMVHERNVVLCALSGISNPEDVQRYASNGVSAVLIGEALMRAENTASFVRKLFGWPGNQLTVSETSRKPRVLVSGVKSASDVEKYFEAGASMLGIIFDPTCKDIGISVETAQEIVAARDIHSKKDLSVALPIPVTSSAPWFNSKLPHLHLFSTHLHLVGIFRNHTLEEIIFITNSLKLDLVALDQDTPISWAKHIPVPVIRRFRCGDRDIFFPGLHSFVLIDVSEPSENFSLVEEAARNTETGPEWPLPIILSGEVTETLKNCTGTLNVWAIEANLEKNENALSLLSALGP